MLMTVFVSRMTGNGVLRTIFRTKMDEITGGLIELYNEKFHNMYLHQILV
jgi:hypothetical protein